MKRKFKNLSPTFGAVLVTLFWLYPLSTSAAAQEPPTLDDVRSRLQQLAEPEKGIPESEILLYEEKRRIEEDLDKFRSLLRQSSIAAKESADSLAKINQAAKEFLQELDGLSCDPVDENKLGAAIRKLGNVRTLLFRHFDDLADDNPWDNIRVSSREIPDKLARCRELKQIDSSKRRELESYIENGLTGSEEKREEGKQLLVQTEQLIQALQKRLTALQAKLSSRESQQTISDKLWIIILAIGALSIGTIVTIKLFDQSLQIEWVASGQVIQFVTVMILLSVVMALGLANILKENTLGTLLGGLAGYVLSQGVGRAAAREVSRRLDRGHPTESP